MSLYSRMKCLLLKKYSTEYLSTLYHDHSEKIYSSLHKTQDHLVQTTNQAVTWLFLHPFNPYLTPLLVQIQSSSSVVNQYKGVPDVWTPFLVKWGWGWPIKSHFPLAVWCWTAGQAQIFSPHSDIRQQIHTEAFYAPSPLCLQHLQRPLSQKVQEATGVKINIMAVQLHLLKETAFYMMNCSWGVSTEVMSIQDTICPVDNTSFDVSLTQVSLRF